MFQNSLPTLKIYSLRHVSYRFLTLAVNFGTAKVFAMTANYYRSIVTVNFH